MPTLTETARLIREQAQAAQATPDGVTGRDIITFRRGMYNPDADGTFVFEGQRRNARQVHAQTEDKDTCIKAIIAQQRQRAGQEESQ